VKDIKGGRVATAIVVVFADEFAPRPPLQPPPTNGRGETDLGHLDPKLKVLNITADKGELTGHAEIRLNSKGEFDETVEIIVDFAPGNHPAE